MSAESVIGKYLCPGCLHGTSPESCGAYEPDTFESGGVGCKAHRLGTAIRAPGNYFALGLPRGFNRSLDPSTRMPSTRLEVWIHETTPPTFDDFNVPVWALERGGALFVRVYSPRLDYGRVVVIIGESLAMVPSAIDVSTFADEID